MQINIVAVICLAQMVSEKMLYLIFHHYKRSSKRSLLFSLYVI